MNKPLTLGSLFDGSGGFPLAGLLTGIVPVWSSEIEPFAIRVTEKRLPQVQHFGNISGLHGAKLPPVDIITFGSPCQDMSIAGKRTGLNGSRFSVTRMANGSISEDQIGTMPASSPASGKPPLPSKRLPRVSDLFISHLQIISCFIA